MTDLWPESLKIGVTVLSPETIMFPDIKIVMSSGACVIAGQEILHTFKTSTPEQRAVKKKAKINLYSLEVRTYLCN